MTTGPLNDVSTTFDFNERNQLESTGTTSYTYDAEGSDTSELLKEGFIIKVGGGRSTAYIKNDDF